MNVADFMIRFFICNVFISGIIGILLIAKRLFKNILSSRMQYHLWFLLLGLLVVPFIPFRLIGFPQIFSWLGSLRRFPSSGTATTLGETAGINLTGNTDWMNLAVVVYWFNPLVWYALREMRNDREVACDTSVLKMLEENEYEEYGNTLINFAEKISLTPFSFAAGLGGSMKQMKRRIINIASYEKPTFMKRLKGITAFVLTAVLLLAFAPFISTYAAESNYYQWDSSSENVSYVDLSSYFGAYEGSFVLYDLENDTWSIHDMDRATLRVAPNSTYKIYDALFGLEEGVITPENTFIAWDGKNYPFDTWNYDQTLQSAMSNSVNWYFQSLNEQLGVPSVHKYIQQIKYGNENMSGDFSSYWMESSLKISPIEQVELLTKLQNNSFSFAPENINAVKDSICISSSDAGSFYGKTGTGRVNGQDVNGWFVGLLETADHTYFFATNIGADSNATGGNATEITMSILSDMNIWE